MGPIPNARAFAKLDLAVGEWGGRCAIADWTVADEFKLIIFCLAGVPDPRHARDRVHPLVGILGLVVLGWMAGARSRSNISRFGVLHPAILKPLGLRRSPSVSTLSRLLPSVPVEAIRQTLFAFPCKLIQLRGPAEVTPLAADGKTPGRFGRKASRCTCGTSLSRRPLWL